MFEIEISLPEERIIFETLNDGHQVLKSPISLPTDINEWFSGTIITPFSNENIEQDFINQFINDFTAPTC